MLEKKYSREFKGEEKRKPLSEMIGNLRKFVDSMTRKDLENKLDTHLLIKENQEGSFDVVNSCREDEIISNVNSYFLNSSDSEIEPIYSISFKRPGNNIYTYISVSDKDSVVIENCEE